MNKAVSGQGMTRLRVLSALLFLATGFLVAQTTPTHDSQLAKGTEYLQDYPVIEFRRYTVREGEREHFAKYFETYFPEAFQQLGAMALGQFVERDKPRGFTWIRGFHSMDERAKINAAFYYGPVWKEHKATLNGLMTDSDNVLLLRPVSPSDRVLVLPAVDPVTESAGAQGRVVAQIFAVKPGEVGAFTDHFARMFSAYASSGVRQAGLLATLDVPNNFPQLPVRTDGPFVVWLGIVPDPKALESSFLPLAKQNLKALTDSGLLRGEPEIVILEPTHRSRLRWLEPK